MKNQHLEFTNHSWGNEYDLVDTFTILEAINNELDLSLYTELFCDDMQDSFHNKFPFVVYEYFTQCQNIPHPIAQNCTHHLYENMDIDDYIDYMFTIEPNTNAA